MKRNAAESGPIRPRRPDCASSATAASTLGALSSDFAPRSMPSIRVNAAARRRRVAASVAAAAIRSGPWVVGEPSEGGGGAEGL